MKRTLIVKVLVLAGVALLFAAEVSQARPYLFRGRGDRRMNNNNQQQANQNTQTQGQQQSTSGQQATSSTTTSSDQGSATTQRSYLGPRQSAMPATIEFLVPANAEIYFQGAKANLMGTQRRFITPALNPEKEYSYQIKVVWTTPSGEQKEKEMELTINAGSQRLIDLLNQTGN